jgi:heat shock protein HtpX
MYNQITSNKRKTVFLIIGFMIFVWGIGYLLGLYNGNPYGGLFAAGFFSIIMTLFSYFSGDKVALMSSGAKQIQKKDNPYLYRMVENLCITSGLPTPKVYIINDPAPNAFATGRDPKHASVAFTTGIIEMLENEELEGVVAHELAHIKNYDIRLMTIVMALVGVISILGDMFLNRLIWGGRDERENNNPMLLILGIAVMIISPIVATIIQLAISRQREFLADAEAALLTRYPEGLANALKKISTYSRPMTRASTATAHLFIANPFGKKSSFKNLFSTHPPAEKRIKALLDMTGQS